MAALNQEEEQAILVQKIRSIYKSLSDLSCLKPCDEVNKLFTELVEACIPPSSIDVSELTPDDKIMRDHLMSICSKAEGLLEDHYSEKFSKYGNPLNNLSDFPYYDNYVKLSKVEYELLPEDVQGSLKRVAFIGSGPLPLSLLVLCMNHMKDATLHGYDIDESATDRARNLIKPGVEVENRIEFITADVMSLTYELKEYEVVFLAALVGIEEETKAEVLAHLHKYMADNSVLVIRSAKGARGFLYPVVRDEDLKYFEVLSVYHPSDDVINSVIIARKPPQKSEDVHVQGHVEGAAHMALTCKFCELKMNGQVGCKMDEMAAREELQS